VTPATGSTQKIDGRSVNADWTNSLAGYSDDDPDECSPVGYWYLSSNFVVTWETHEPTVLTKPGCIIDNPWTYALDRARAPGSVCADILVQGYFGVRPITLMSFSLGARVIFYALLELERKKSFGIAEDVFLLGRSRHTPSAVSRRYVNAYARNNWLLNYLFKATSGSVRTVAGLHPVESVPGLGNVDVTDKISGHMSYRMFVSD